MKTKSLVALALLCLCAFAAYAQEQQKMTPEQQAMMEKWMKAMTPSEGHKRLDHMVGTWNTKVSMWEAPGGQPQVSDGVSENRWIMGGRYLEQRYTGTMMGQPFEGVGYTGYDNVKGAYWGTWMDNMSTGVMTSWGNTKDNGKTWTFTGTHSDPMTGKEAKTEERITVQSHDQHTFEMWGAGPDGKSFRMMEIVYTRKK